MLNSSYVEALEHLRRSVAALPSSVPTGHPSGVINRYFRVQPCDSVKDPWIVTSEAYTRCFADNPNSNKRAIDNVRQGQYGMECVVKFFEGLKTCPGVSTSNLLHIEQTIRDIAELVDEKVQLLVPTSAKKPMPSQQIAPNVELSKPSSHTHRTEEDFTDLVHDKQALGHDSEDETDKQSQAHLQPDRANNSGVNSRPGPQDSVRQWALSHFETPVPGEFENRSGVPAWLFKCKHCGLVRRLPRTAGCEIIEQEPLRISSGNLSKHLRLQCKKIPQAEGWEAAQACTQQSTTIPASNAASLSLGVMFASETPVPPPPPTALSKSIFRSTLIRGMVQDTLPLTFGEGEGMKMVFQLVNPLVSLPTHHTSR
ncbi:hypothetical protein FRC12_016802 [Ceratobasidium sp. 428]|nr:hypothetical protein FRC12_016802 [Ceratobasidium sp. 428]